MTVKSKPIEASNLTEARDAAYKIGFPVVVKPVKPFSQEEKGDVVEKKDSYEARNKKMDKIFRLSSVDKVILTKSTS